MSVDAARRFCRTLLRNHEYPPRLADTGGQEAALAGQQGQLANERSRSKRDQDELIVAVGPCDR